MSRHAKGTRQHTIGTPVRGAGVITEREHDPYADRGKPPEPAVCPGCGATVHEGRWQWKPAPPDAPEHLCPACRRERDHFPAGVVQLGGEFFAAHRDEVMQRVQSHAHHAREEHPLQRILKLDVRGDSAEVTTTDAHLARGIGQALHDAYRGELHLRHEPGQAFVRVSWTR